MTAMTGRARAVLASVVEKFKTSDMTTAIRSVYLDPVPKPCQRWSWGNRVLVALAGTTDARGIRQWREVGRHPRKGSKAVYILAPLTRRVPADGDGGEDGQDTRTITVGWRGVPVFRVQDTEGCALKAVKGEPKSLPPLSAVAERWGFSVRYDATFRGEDGSCDPRNCEIRLCTADEAVFFHELSHLAHDRLQGEKLKPGQDPEQEAIAELAACVLASMYGRDRQGEAYTYISHYADGKDPDSVGRLCLRVVEKTGRVLDMILGEAEAAGVEVAAR